MLGSLYQSSYAGFGKILTFLLRHVSAILGLEQLFIVLITLG